MENEWTWTIEIDGLPINSMVIFHGYVSHNQMVTSPASMGLTVFPIACHL